jgi:hypothetical protein
MANEVKTPIQNYFEKVLYENLPHTIRQQNQRRGNAAYRTLYTNADVY